MICIGFGYWRLASCYGRQRQRMFLHHPGRRKVSSIAVGKHKSETSREEGGDLIQLDKSMGIA